MKIILGVLLSLLTLSTFLLAQPVELGTIRWLRNYDTAVERSKASGKPLLILFQEVPG